MLVDNNDYEECTPFARSTAYKPLDTLLFNARYQWKDHLFVPDHESKYVIGEDVPEKLARALITDCVARPGPTLWENQEAYEYDIECVPRIKTVFVPEYSRTDFYSVPRALWWLYPTSGVGRKAAHVHDLFCNPNQTVRFLTAKDELKECVFPVTSREAADIFLEAMEVALVPKPERLMKYYGVRSWFGPRFKAECREHAS